MIKTVTILALVLLVRCSPAVAPDAGWAGSKWVLMEMNGVPVQVSGTDKDAHLVFSTGDKKYSGSSGCNRLMGSYSVSKKGSISFGTPAGTRMICPDQRFEDAFMKAFSTVNRYETSNDELLLKQDNNVVMRMKRM